MSAKLVLRVEWNETVRTCRDPFDTKKFSNLSPEILVQWIAPLLSGTQIFKTFDRHMSTMFDYPSQLRAQFAGERGFQNPGVCLQAFPSFPSPTPTFPFLVLAPFSAREKYPKSPSSVFLCSQTPRKRLLRRLQWCTFSIAVPDLYLRLFWWPLVQRSAPSSLKLGSKGDASILLFPAKSVPAMLEPSPLHWDLWVSRPRIPSAWKHLPSFRLSVRIKFVWFIVLVSFMPLLYFWLS